MFFLFLCGSRTAGGERRRHGSAPCQKAEIEVGHELIRRVVPKGKNIDELTQRLGCHEVAGDDINLTPGLLKKRRLFFVRNLTLLPGHCTIKSCALAHMESEVDTMNFRVNIVAQNGDEKREGQIAIDLLFISLQKYNCKLCLKSGELCKSHIFKSIF